MYRDIRKAMDTYRVFDGPVGEFGGITEMLEVINITEKLVF